MTANSVHLHKVYARLSWLAAYFLNHYCRWFIVYAFAATAVFIFHQHFIFGINASPSLPYTLFLVHKGAPVERGQLVAFRWNGAGPYPEGVTFVKIAAGVPGDRVVRDGRAFYVNGVFVGIAKTHTGLGRPLEVSAPGVLPPGHYYVAATHPDSLDSRYRMTGWIPQERIIGRAYAIF
ncbi:MAG: S26 family signal peptidase [Pseudomonadota bacterium]